MDQFFCCTLGTCVSLALFLTQACSAHNPTGCDLTLEQWEQILALTVEKKFLPIFDTAYQGSFPLTFPPFFSPPFSIQELTNQSGEANPLLQWFITTVADVVLQATQRAISTTTLLPRGFSLPEGESFSPLPFYSPRLSRHCQSLHTTNLCFFTSCAPKRICLEETFISDTCLHRFSP